MRRPLPIVAGAGCLVALVTAGVLSAVAREERGVTALFSLFSVSYVLVGVLVCVRRPGHPVGRLMLGIGVLTSTAVLLGAYATYAVGDESRAPLAVGAAWLTSWLYWPMLAGIVLMVLIFPDGTLTGPVRRWAARVLLAAAVVLTVASALAPGPMDGFDGEPNPVGVPSLGPAVDVAVSAAAAVLAITFLVALSSVFVRRRRAVGPERGQLSWLAYATVLMVLGEGLNAPVLGLDDSFFGLLAVVVAIIAFPVAVAVAILRYRLYDIDRIISRTLVYGTLTATLVAAYFGSVLLFRVLLDPFAPGSDLAVAVSTLAVAALFRPVRARVQQVVDRRFYRRRYDAVREIERFSGRLRQELDLTAIGGDLRAVVHDTMRPTHVSLWLRQAP